MEVSHQEAASRVAARFENRFLNHYIRWKLRADPACAVVFEHLRGRDTPIIEIGCGVGMVAFYLRERGFDGPIVGIDHDRRKIDEALRVAGEYRDVEFAMVDARAVDPAGRSVLLLDVLHYFTDEVQGDMLRRVAGAVPPGGVVIIRDGVRDGSWRYRLTYVQESFARAIRWLEAERLHFPTRAQIEGPFREMGYEESVMPCWGNTPYNNYLFVFNRPSSGTTKA